MAISPAAQKISDAAVLHFAEKGFDGGSLNSVADLAGIKKATIYSHFKNKDELFTHVFHEAVVIESAFASNCFKEDESSGERYLSQLAQRYQASGHLRLMLRTAFIPPESMLALVAKGYASFLDNLKAHFIAGLRPETPSDTMLLADAYLGIVDSVHVELLYATPDAAEKRRIALCHLLLNAM